ncbi:hypothetical protein ACP4OV_019632 [Aristida adscensionis]
MAISSALSFLSDRKRPLVVGITLFILLSSLVLLFSPAPSALPFFSSPSSRLTSSSDLADLTPSRATTPVAVPADAAPPEAPTAVAPKGASGGGGGADPPRPDTPAAVGEVAGNVSRPDRRSPPAAAGDVEANVSRPDHGSPPAAPAEESRSASNNEPPAGVSGKRDGAGRGGGVVEERVELPSWELCEVGMGLEAADYIPCLDNVKAIKKLKSLRHMEHRERHCPTSPRPRCLVPLPPRYRRPVPWPRSRDMVRTPACLLRGCDSPVPWVVRSKCAYVLKFSETELKTDRPGKRSPELCQRRTKIMDVAVKIWYNNVPHPKLVEYKKDQNWVRKSGNYFVFPGGGTQFKTGVTAYIRFIEQIMPDIQWGIHTRTVLDVGCGVASFGGYLLDRNVITMSFAPKDEHEAQIQFALERGIPAFLAVIGTQKLPFPDNSFDVIHCARCRVHWYADGGKPLMELNRVLRPGGYYIWSATPVYRKDQRDVQDWNAMVALTKSICWRAVIRSRDVNKIGVVIYQKPISNSCYLERRVNEPPLCSESDGSRSPWYAPLDSCILPAVSSSGGGNNWPIPWPERLHMKHSTTSNNSSTKFSQEKIDSDASHWKELVSEVYLKEFAVNWSSVRNVMDMNAGFGGSPDTLPIIFNRGLIGVYHDWCESFNTYPRTYDLLHMSYLLGGLTNRCHITEVAAEIDRILRPGRWFVLQDSIEMIRRMDPVLRSLHYRTTIVKQQFLVATKGFWRPSSTESQS